MFIRNWRQNVFTIPNLLSLLRLFLIPVYAVLYLNAKTGLDHLTAGIILALSCLTDALDGFIARKYNMHSTLGKILDPLADKATQITTAICLSLRYPILLTIVILLLTKEVLQIAGTFFLLHKAISLPGAMMAGKISTMVLFVSLILLVLFPNVPGSVVTLLTILTSGFLIYAFFTYLLSFFKNVNSLPRYQT